MGILACRAILEFVRRRDSWLAGSRQPTTIRYAFVVNDEHTLVRLVPTLAVQCTLLPSVFLWMKRSRFLGHTKCFSLFVYSSSFRISNTLRSPGKEENTSKKTTYRCPVKQKNINVLLPRRGKTSGAEQLRHWRVSSADQVVFHATNIEHVSSFWSCQEAKYKCAMSSFKKILACLKQFSYSRRITSN